MSLINTKSCYIDISFDIDTPKFWGTEIKGYETMSEMFDFGIAMIRENKPFDYKSILGKRANIKIYQQGKCVKQLNGHVSAMNSGEQLFTGTYFHNMKISPWTIKLSQTHRYQIFQDKTFVEIFQQIARETGIAHYDTHLINKKLQKRPYTVQYDETDLEFIHRLLQQEGIFYFFEHHDDKHVMVLCDNVHFLKALKSKQYSHAEMGRPHLNDFIIRVGQYPQTFIGANVDLSGWKTFDANAKVIDTFNHLSSKQSVDYQFPVHAFEREEMESIIKRGAKYNEALAHRCTFAGNDIEVNLANYFNLTDHPDESHNRKYLITHYYLEAIDTTHFSKEQSQHHKQSFFVNVDCLPEPYTYVAPAPVKWPELSGCHIGKVLGPKPLEPHTDEFGRIKVEMQWNSDHKPTCWIPVVQTVAGPLHGDLFIPRASDEVAINFFNGNPDLPVIIGAFYNGINLPPNDNEEYEVYTSIETLCQANPALKNQIIFNDKIGDENIEINAAKDLVIDVANDLNEHIGGNLIEQVDGERSVTVEKGSYTLNAGEALFKVGNSELRLDENGLTLKADKVIFETEAGVSAPISTIGDHHKCLKLNLTTLVPHIGGAIMSGSPNIFIQGKPVARVGDKAHCLMFHDKITHGIPTLTANGRPVAYAGSKTDHNGKVTQGSHKSASGKYSAPPMKKHFNGLQTIKVLPQFRKIVPENKFDDLSTLLRLPETLQSLIINDIIKHYTPEKIEDAKTIKLPKDYKKWTQLIKNKSLIETAKKALHLDKTQNLQNGWIYVLGECADAPEPDFQQMHGFKEYAVIDADGKYSFAEVDLSQHAGKDLRPSQGEKDFIELPYQYIKDDKPKSSPFKVQVLFSQTQLSWPRLHRLAGLAANDKRLKEIKEKDQLELISKVQSYPVDEKFREKRAGKFIPQDDLTMVYNVQYMEGKKKIISTEGSEQTTWKNNSLYYTSDIIDYAVLLLNDPIGMVVVGNTIIFNLIKQYKHILKSLPNKNINITSKEGEQKEVSYFHSALLAQQLFKQYNYGNIIKHNGNYCSLETNEELPWAKAEDMIEQYKLDWWLDHFPREAIHGLIHQIQHDCVTILLENWDVENESPKSPKDTTSWHVDIDECLKDLFAKNKNVFGLAYSYLQGLISLLCLDTRATDEKMTVDNRFINHNDLLIEYKHALYNYDKYDKFFPYFIVKYKNNDIMGVANGIKLIPLQMPAGLLYLDIFHNEKYPIHHCFFPHSEISHQASDDLLIYLKGEGYFQTAGFEHAFKAKDIEIESSEDEKENPIPEKINDFFSTILTSYISKASRIRERKIKFVNQTIKDVANKSRRARRLYHKLLRHGSNEDFDKMAKRFIEEYDHSPQIRKYLSKKNFDTFSSIAKNPNEGIELYPAVRKMQKATAVIGLYFVIMSCYEEYANDLAKSTQHKSALVLISDITYNLARLGSPLQASQEILGKFFGEEKVEKWINESKVGKYCEKLTRKITHSLLGKKTETKLTSLINGWGIVACGLDLGSSILGLINVVTGNGSEDPARVISQLFDTVGNGFLFTSNFVNKDNNLLASKVKSKVVNEKMTTVTNTNTASESLILPEANQITPIPNKTEVSKIAIKQTSSEALDVFTTDEVFALTTSELFGYIGIACIIISSIVSELEHNAFQIWAENSPFNSDDANIYLPWANHPSILYHALIALIVYPVFNVKLNQICENQYEKTIKISAYVPSLKNFEKLQHGYLNLEYDYKYDVQSSDNFGGYKTELLPDNLFDMNKFYISQNVEVNDQQGYVHEIVFNQNKILKTAMNIAHEIDTSAVFKLKIIPKAQLDYGKSSFPPDNIPYPNSEGRVDKVVNWIDNALNLNDKLKIQESHQWWVGEEYTII